MATEAWQQATGNTSMLPDLGDLLRWALSRAEGAEAEAAANAMDVSQAHDLAAENCELATENARLSARDGNAKIELCYDDGENPFAREQLTLADFGVSGNVYVVESKMVSSLRTALRFMLDPMLNMYAHQYFLGERCACEACSRQRAARALEGK